MHCIFSRNFIILKNTNRLNQVVMGDLRKKMVYHMGTNIMVDVVYPSIVTVNGGKSSPQVTPFLYQEFKFL